MNSDNMAGFPPAPAEGLVADVIKHLAADFSFDGEGAAAPHSFRLPQLSSGGNIELSGPLDESGDRHSGSSHMRSPPRLAPANSQGASRPASSAPLVAGRLKGASADMMAKQRGLQLRRFSIIDSSTSDRSAASHASYDSPSSAASASRQRRRRDSVASARSKHWLSKKSPFHPPAARLGEETSLQSFSTAGGDAVAPSPKELDGAQVAGDSSRLRQPPQCRGRVAPAALPSDNRLGPSAVVSTVPDAPLAAVTSPPFPLPEARKRSVRGHGASAARRASPGRAEKSRPAPATAEVQKPPSQRQWKDGEQESPSSRRGNTTTSPRTHQTKSEHCMHAPCARVTKPTNLYDRGIKGLLKASAKREAMRAKLEEATLAEATFHPCISSRGKALKRSGDTNVANRDSTAQLRYRLHLLELPDGAADVAHRYTPRLSHTSEMIVRACRERGGAELPPEERLYRDYFYRLQAIEEARVVTSPPAVVRSKRDIEAHIAELYSFEQQRQRAITAAREALQSASAEARQRHYVDPRALVERLTKKRSPSQRRTAASAVAKDECFFHPQTSASAGELARHACLRGLHRWVRYFCDSDTLSTPVLSTFRGEASHAAATLSALLWRHSPTKTEWSVEELADALAAEAVDNLFVAELWRRRPPVGESSALSGELTFRPRLNPKSAIIVNKMEAQHRCGPIYDRLFLSARVRQLSQRQRELEEEQASLEVKQREQQRQQRLQDAWRAQEANRLEAYRAEKAKEHQNGAAGETAAAQERPHPCTPTRSHRLLAATSSPQPRSGRRGSDSPSSLRKQPTVAAAAAVTLSPRSFKSSTSATPSASSPGVARVSGSITGITLKATNSGEGGGGRRSSCPSSVSHPTKSSGQAAPVTAGLRSSFPRSLDDGPVTDNRELDRAAKELRDLLASPSRPCRVAQKSSTASSQLFVPAAHCVTPSDADRSRDSRGKLHWGTLDIVLACAQLRDPGTLPSAERERLDRAQKRQLRELGRLLYSRHISRVYGISSM
ncbi:hypothetical protein LSCM4_05928 [Leishmania orientalis]|uniref:Uncharacterized protein n=1 Tax=Leishmania orientalis TaxID=2249476 RepID=A0A836HN96_9TRYP|nr:hypothetical protein LSCM4_05928 [Leishmania orientalis]